MSEATVTAANEFNNTHSGPANLRREQRISVWADLHLTIKEQILKKIWWWINITAYLVSSGEPFYLASRLQGWVIMSVFVLSSPAGHVASISGKGGQASNCLSTQDDTVDYHSFQLQSNFVCVCMVCVWEEQMRVRGVTRLNAVPDSLWPWQWTGCVGALVSFLWLNMVAC